MLLDHIKTPIGQVAILCDATEVLRAVGFVDEHPRMAHALVLAAQANGVRTRAAQNPGGYSEALQAYFAGELGAIQGLRYALVGTPFQQRVWRALAEIPCGQTRSYGDIARSIGSAKAVRAVGLANARNPVAIVVPCHRVIGADGSLTGYGAGTERKSWLLRHEGVKLPR